jgi:hypothetical protein
MQLGVLITNLESILEIQKEKAVKMKPTSPDYLFLLAEQEIVEQLSIKLQKKYIDQKSKYTVSFLKIHALLVIKYQDDCRFRLSDSSYYQNEIQLLSNELHYKLINQ